MSTFLIHTAPAWAVDVYEYYLTENYPKMDAEKLNKANALAAEIKKFKAHRADIEWYSKMTDHTVVKVYDINKQVSSELWSGYLPFPKDRFLAVYFMAIDAKIAELEKELAAL